MPTRRPGHSDQQLTNKLGAGTAALATVYLALYAGSLPLSDGTGGMEVSPATRPGPITWGAVAQDANGRHYKANSAAITGIVLSNTAPAYVVGFGLCAASSGGVPLYTNYLPGGFQAAAGATISIPAGALIVYAEPPTI